MKKCGSRRPTPFCGGSTRSRKFRSVDEIVEAFIRERRGCCLSEMDFYKGKPLHEVIQVAALSVLPNGKRHNHQRRIPGSALKEAAARLSGAEFSSVSSFDDLHSAIGLAIRGIHKIGELAVYDIAHRIGAKLRLQPEKVYLHAGTRVGARALGFTGVSVSMEELPKAFQRLTPAEAEDCLCVFKDHLKALERVDG